MDCLADTPPIELHNLQAEAGLLRVGIARPLGTSRGTILILNGRSEFIEKYRTSLSILAGWSYTSVILDWRGQGGSWRDQRHPRKGHVDDFAAYLDDLDHVLAWMREEGLKRVDLVIGHSMGGHLVLRSLVERQLRARAAIFIAPMFDIALDLPRWFVSGIANIGATLGLKRAYAPGQGDVPPARRRFETNRLTSDQELFETFRQLLLHHEPFRVGGVTYGWLRAALRSISRTWQEGYAEALKLPSVVLTGGEDRVISNRAAVAMADRLAARHVDFPAARHDLLWEVPKVRERIWQEIHDVLDELADRSVPRERQSATQAAGD